MANFAQLDNENKVVRVIVLNNSDILDENGNESEEVGIRFCEKLFGGGTWLQTSYNGSFRYNFAGIGYQYDGARDAFIPIKPYVSWVFNEDNCQWKAPIDKPQDNNLYVWSELTRSWVIHVR